MISKSEDFKGNKFPEIKKDPSFEIVKTKERQLKIMLVMDVSRSMINQMFEQVRI